MTRTLRVNKPPIEIIMEQSKLAQIREAHSRQVEKNRQLEVSQQTAKQVSLLEESMLKSFQLLVKFLDGKTTKTEVVNQLKEISTPDVDKVVRAVQTLNNTTSQNKIDLTPIREGLKSLEDQLKLIPKEKVEFEQREDVRVTNLKDIKIPELDTSKLEKAIKELKLEAPTVNLPQTEVNVDAPDIKPLQKGLKDLLDGIKGIHIPEVPITDLKEVEKKLDESNVKLQKLVDKPGPNLGPGTPYVEAGTGKPLFVELDNGAVPITGSITAASSTLAEFQVNDIEDDTTSYFGFTEPDGTWMVKKLTDTSVSYATVTNNGAVTSYTDAWTNRATLTYGRYDQAF